MPVTTAEPAKSKPSFSARRVIGKDLKIIRDLLSRIDPAGWREVIGQVDGTTREIDREIEKLCKKIDRIKADAPRERGSNKIDQRALSEAVNPHLEAYSALKQARSAVAEVKNVVGRVVSAANILRVLEKKIASANTGGKL